MRIERIGSALSLDGIQRLEWHHAPIPDGRYLRLPLPDVILTINLGVVGEWRARNDGPWHPFPMMAFRGICVGPSEGRDPDVGAISYLSLVIAPWAVRSYFGIGASALANRIVDGAAQCPALPALQQQLREAHQPDACLDVVTDWLRKHHRPQEISARGRSVIESIRADRSIADIARSHRVSARTVHQLCLAETGTNPSSYRQIARFARLAVALHADGGDAWNRHLFEYADHSHAIRAFRRRSGSTPRLYAEGRGERPRAFSIVPKALDADDADAALHGV
jgi:AraC-like DNA-binding protein